MNKLTPFCHQQTAIRDFKKLALEKYKLSSLSEKAHTMKEHLSSLNQKQGHDFSKKSQEIYFRVMENDPQAKNFREQNIIMASDKILLL